MKKNTEIDLTEVGWAIVDRIDQIHDRDKRRALVHGNEISGTIKSKKILEKLSNWWLLKDDPAQSS